LQGLNTPFIKTYPYNKHNSGKIIWR
jgi:hypothetical protein